MTASAGSPSARRATASRLPGQPPCETDAGHAAVIGDIILERAGTHAHKWSNSHENKSLYNQNVTRKRGTGGSRNPDIPNRETPQQKTIPQNAGTRALAAEKIGERVNRHRGHRRGDHHGNGSSLAYATDWNPGRFPRHSSGSRIAAAARCAQTNARHCPRT